MEVHYEDEDKLPPPPKKVASNIKQIVGILENMPAGKVAVVKPGPDQSIRGLKTSFGRIASSHGWEVVTWSEKFEDDPPVLLVKRTK